MLQVNVLETKNGLSKFLRMLESGQEDCIVIARHNKPVAQLTIYENKPDSKRIGVAKGKKIVSDGWDAPEINDEVAAMFGAS